MSRIGTAVRNRMNNARTRRAVNNAIEHASTPGMRDELRTMAQLQGLSLR